MEIYAALLLLPLLWAGARHAGGKADRIAVWIIWAALTLFIGLRREVGADWDNYLIMFQRGHIYPLETALAIGDSAYMLAGRALAELGLGLGALNLLCAAIFTSGLIAYCARTVRPPLALLIATPALIAILAIGSARQSAAIGLVMLALGLWRRERRRLPATLLLLAPFWHWSALLTWPLIPLLLWPRRIPPALGLAAGLLLGLGLVLLAQSSIVAAAVELSVPARGALLRYIPSLVALAAMLLLWSRLFAAPAERNAMTGWAALVAMLGCAILVIPTPADRLGFYAVLGQMAVMTRLPDAVGDRKPWATAGIAALYLIFFLGWLALTPYRSCWAPYRTYLTDPGALIVRDATEPIRRDNLCRPDQVQPNS